jgi:Flp pilus assembly protein protease CpaA
MFEVIFLGILAIIWIVFATIQDLRTREIANWLNFSLIIFALGFRFFYSLFNLGDFGFFYQGLIGLGIFFVLGNLLYYGKMFAGGDAKLMIALGAVLPFTSDFFSNLRIFTLFFFIFLFVGALYSLVISLSFSLKNFPKFKREFSSQLRKSRRLSYSVSFLGIILIAFGFIENLLFTLGALVFVSPYFYIYAKAVDEAFLVKKIRTSKLREGDWLYRNIKIGNRTIKANWEGLKKHNIKLIQKKYKSILIREGIPFTPVFLISFLVFLYFWKTGLWNSLW